MPDNQPKIFELYDFTPFLVARVGALMPQSIGRSLEDAGITLQMWRVLMVVHFNGPLTLIDISRALGVKSSTLSRLVGRMIEKKLLTRRRSTRDARTVQISLRREGEKLFDRLWPEAAKIEEIVAERFSPADLQRLKDMLREVESVLLRYHEATQKPRRRKKTTASGPKTPAARGKK